LTPIDAFEKTPVHVMEKTPVSGIQKTPIVESFTTLAVGGDARSKDSAESVSINNSDDERKYNISASRVSES